MTDRAAVDLFCNAADGAKRFHRRWLAIHLMSA